MVTRLLFLWLALCASACAAPGAADFAIVRMNAKGELRLYSSAPLKRDATIWTQVAGPGDSTLCCRRLKVSELQPAQEDGVIAIDKATDQALISHLGTMPKDWPHTAFIGIAAIGAQLRVRGHGTRLDVTDAQGSMISADLCTSREGVHVVNPSAPAMGPRLYLWLGYDIEEPTCAPLGSQGALTR